MTLFLQILRNTYITATALDRMFAANCRLQKYCPTKTVWFRCIFVPFTPHFAACQYIDQSAGIPRGLPACSKMCGQMTATSGVRGAFARSTARHLHCRGLYRLFGVLLPRQSRDVSFLPRTSTIRLCHHGTRYTRGVCARVRLEISLRGSTQSGA